MKDYKEVMPAISEQRRPHPIESTLFASMAAGVVALFLGLLLERPWQELWRWPIIGFLIPVALFLFTSVGLVIEWAIENLTHQDRNKDGVIGKPGHIMAMNTSAARATAERYFEYPEGPTYDELIRFLERSATMGTSEGAQEIKRGSVAAQRYLLCRDKFMDLRLARWINPTKHSLGWELSTSMSHARAVLSRYLTELPPTPPKDR